MLHECGQPAGSGRAFPLASLGDAQTAMRASTRGSPINNKEDPLKRIFLMMAGGVAQHTCASTGSATGKELLFNGGRASIRISSPQWGPRSSGSFSGEGGIRTRGRDLWSRQPLSRRPHSTTLAPPQYSLVKPAEGEGFEPTVSCPTPVFKTGALNHSAILPGTAGVAARTFYHT